MSENRIATTPATGFRRLGLRGQPLVATHAQLTQILGNRLGREHARLFARPNLDPTTGSIEWFTTRTGQPRTLAELEPEERQRIAALNEQLLREIDQLAQKLKREGPSAEIASQMLSGALQHPPGDWLFEVDDQPVQIMWGHVTEQGGVAAAVPFGPQAPLAGAAAAPPLVAAAEVPVIVAARSGLPRFWWLWLLLLLLILALAYLFATDRLVGFGIGERSASPPTTPAIDDALARQRGLLDELARLRQLRPNDPRALACIRVDPDTPPLVLDPSTTDPRAPGPDVATDQVVPPGPTGPLTPTLPPTLPDTGPVTTDRTPVPDTGPVATDRMPVPDTDGPGTTITPQIPLTVPPQAPADTARPLTIPPDAAGDSKLDFLRGDWQAGPGLLGTKGKPIDLALRFGEGGKGQVSIRRPSDGSTCVGPVDAKVAGGKLSVTGSGEVKCDKGEPFARPQFECARGARGKTLCNGVNGDQSTYEMDIYRSKP